MNRELITDRVKAFLHDWLASFRNGKGRLSRSLYFWYSTALTVALTVAAALVALYARLLLGAGFYQTFASVWFLLLLLATPWAIILTVQRFHDWGWSGWWLLAIIAGDVTLRILTHDLREAHVEIRLLIGLIDLAIPIAICLWPGTPGDNRFGRPVLATSTIEAVAEK